MPKSGQDWDPTFLLDHPLFRLWEPWAKEFRQPRWPGPSDYSESLRRFSERASAEMEPLRFVELPKKPRRAKRNAINLLELYDGRIALSGEVPCISESYHDLFNALVFCAFPRAKRALHRRQFLAQRAWLEASGVFRAGTGLPGRRSPEQDALTILDEAGTVIVMSPAGYDGWRRGREAQGLSCSALSEGVPLLFGHALLEHLNEGRRTLRSSGVVLVIEMEEESLLTEPSVASLLFDRADRALADRLQDPTQFRRPGADVIFGCEADGTCWLGPPKPAWHSPHPGGSRPASCQSR